MHPIDLKKERLSTIINFVKSIFNGFSQIMLQENPWTGFLFFVGIGWGSITMAFSALLAVVVATITAVIIKCSKEAVFSGLFGFNAALIGVALFVFFQPTFYIWMLVVVLSVLSVSLQQFFMARKISVFTLPFVLLVWLVYYFAYFFMPDLLLTSTDSSLTFHFLDVPFKGYAQVIFQDISWVGFIFFIGVLLQSRLSALWGIIGAIIGAVLHLLLHSTAEEMYTGLLGYNSVLCALALVGNSYKDRLWIVPSVVVAVFITIAMKLFGIIVLTFPFVASVVFVLNLKIILDNKKPHSKN